jgi:2-oxoglutarate dehydrogenase E2 component (dihydrolipoamide succinyltransferase)
MSTEVKVPQLGESIVEATVGRWFKQEGDSVEMGEPLVELETEKVTVEVPASMSGVLQSIVKHEGDTVGIGDVLAVLQEAEETTAQPSPPQWQGTPPEQHVAVQPGAMGDRSAPPAEHGTDGDAAVRATPLAKRIGAEHGVDLSQIRGTGPSGRVTREDVTRYLEQQRAAAATEQPTAVSQPAVETPAAAPAPVVEAAGRWEERIRMSRRRQTIARRLVEAQHTAAMLTTFNEVDMSAILEVRRRRRDTFKERYGVSLGFMSFFTKAVIGALKAFPRLNAEIQGDEMIIKHYYDIGIAVATDEGLVVPVLRDADRLSFAEIERQIADLAERARKNQLSLAELQGGTFTITNGGVFGSLLSTPILNTPQVGILGMHKVEERPVVVNGEIVIRPMMYVALSYDHRIVDGSEAVRFLVRCKELLEDPETLLLEG